MKFKFTVVRLNKEKVTGLLKKNIYSKITANQ